MNEINEETTAAFDIADTDNKLFDTIFKRPGLPGRPGFKEFYIKRKAKQKKINSSTQQKGI